MAIKNEYWLDQIDPLWSYVHYFSTYGAIWSLLDDVVDGNSMMEQRLNWEDTSKEDQDRLEVKGFLTQNLEWHSKWENWK